MKVDVGVALFPHLDGVLTHELFFIVGQENAVLVDDPGVAGGAGAHAGRDFIGNENGVDQQLQDAVRRRGFRRGIESGEKRHDHAALPGGAAGPVHLAQKKATLALGVLQPGGDLGGQAVHRLGGGGRFLGAPVLVEAAGLIIPANLQNAQAAQILEAHLHVLVKPGGVRGDKAEAPGIGQELAFQVVEVGLDVVGDFAGQLQLLLVELLLEDVLHFPVQPLPEGKEQHRQDDGAGQDKQQYLGEGQGPARPAREHVASPHLP